MKKLILSLALLLPTIPFMAQAVLGESFKNAAEEAGVEVSEETEAAALEIRITALTTTLDVAIAALDTINTSFQANQYYTAESKAEMDQVVTTATAELEDQKAAIAAATSTEELNAARDEAIATLKSYEEEIRAVLKDATIDAYERMIAGAETVIAQIEALVPVLQRAGVDTTELESLLAECEADIEAANAAFYPAVESKDPAQVKAAGEAIAELSRDLAALVVLAEEMAPEEI